MFREIRRNKQELTKTECEEIMIHCTSGVLSVIGDDDYPYGVPISYVYSDNCLYFHSALTGHKVDAIKRHEKVSFSVIRQDNVQAKELTTYYKSVVVFGKASIVQNNDEKLRYAKELANKYSAEYPSEIQTELDSYFDKMLIIKVEIEHLSGKCAKELING